MKNSLMLIILSLICHTQLSAVEYYSNQYYYPSLNTSTLLTNFQYKPDYKVFTPEETAQGAKLSRIEILYGRFEHLDANIMIARETDEIDYLINYNRSKIDSYRVNNKKIYNSAFGHDDLKSSISLLKQQNNMIHLNFNYQYYYGGLHSNTNYNNYIKRNIILSPEFKYFFSERSFFQFNFLFSHMNLEHESVYLDLNQNYSYFQTKIDYKRVFSSINSFTIQFYNILDSMEIDEADKNNYSYIALQNKSPLLSRKIVLNIGTKFNINKNYPFVFSPSGNLLFIFRYINWQIGYQHLYNYFAFHDQVKQYRFNKFTSIQSPHLNNQYYSTIFISFLKELNYNIKYSYNDVKNHLESKEDSDQLYITQKRDKIQYMNIEHELFIKLTHNWMLRFVHSFIPYKKQKKVSNLINNTAGINIEADYDIIRSGIKISYYDLNYFIDTKNNFTIIKPNIFMDIYFKIFFTETFGFILKAKNISDKKIMLNTQYPEIEKIITAGVIAEF